MRRHPIIVLWTTPRSRSTAFERMMIERGDHVVFDEPFSARYYFSSESRSTRFEQSEPDSTGTAVSALLCDASADGPVFVKDMAYHATGLLDQDLLGDFVNCFLVREPTAALISLERKWPDFTDEEAGYKALETAWEVARTLQSDVPVIDADDLTVDPEGTVEAFCAAVGIPFMQTAMTWEPGLVDQWTRWHDWYAGVADSTGFNRRDASGEPRPPARTTSRVAAMLAEATDVYERIAATKLVAKRARL